MHNVHFNVILRRRLGSVGSAEPAQCIIVDNQGQNKIGRVFLVLKLKIGCNYVALVFPLPKQKEQIFYNVVALSQVIARIAGRVIICVLFVCVDRVGERL